MKTIDNIWQTFYTMVEVGSDHVEFTFYTCDLLDLLNRVMDEGDGLKFIYNPIKGKEWKRIYSSDFESVSVEHHPYALALNTYMGIGYGIFRTYNRMWVFSEERTIITLLDKRE